MDSRLNPSERISERRQGEDTCEKAEERKGHGSRLPAVSGPPPAPAGPRLPETIQTPALPAAPRLPSAVPEKPAAGSRLPAAASPKPSAAPRLPRRDVETSAENAKEEIPAGKPTLESLMQQGRDLPALPKVVMQILEVTGRGETSAKILAQVASQDPMFAARMLRMANSAYYGLPRSVGTLTEAVMMLGNHTLRNLAVVAAAHDTLCMGIPGYALEDNELWRHSIACAITASYLADVVQYPDKEEAFVAGLLHDVGKVILGRHLETYYAEIQAGLDTPACEFVTLERQIFGFDHAELGGHIALHWNLPKTLAQAIAQHQQPEKNGRITPLAALTHAANAVCLLAGIGLGIDGLRARICGAAFQSLKLEERDVLQTLNDLTRLLEEAQPLLTIT